MEEIEQMRILRELGLTDGEAKVYLLLSKRGKLSASQIARETRLNRSNTYKILERLIEKKLVFSSLVEKTRFFSATRPERLKEIYEQSIRLLKGKEKEISDFVSNIKKLEKTKPTPIPGFSIEVHEGVEEIRNISENILGECKKEENVYSFGYEYALEKVTGVYWWQNFIKRRAMKNIRFRAVFNFHKKAKKPKLPLTEVKYANLRQLGNIEVAMYKNVVLILVMSKDIPRAILIRSKDITDGFKDYFNFLWGKAIIPK